MANTGGFSDPKKMAHSELVLFIPGFPAYTTRNKDIASHLKKNTHFEVEVLEYEGLDSSPKLFSFKEAIEKISRTLEILSPKYDRIFIVAHSFGAFATLASPTINNLKNISGILFLNPLVTLPSSEQAANILTEFAEEEMKIHAKLYRTEELVKDIENLRQSQTPHQFVELVRKGFLKVSVLQATQDVITPSSELKSWIDANELQGFVDVSYVEDDHWFKDRSQITKLVLEKLKRNSCVSVF